MQQDVEREAINKKNKTGGTGAARLGGGGTGALDRAKIVLSLEEGGTGPDGEGGELEGGAGRGGGMGGPCRRQHGTAPGAVPCCL